MNRFLPGVGVHVNDRKEEEGTTGREKWLELLQKREMRASHGQRNSVEGRCACVCVCHTLFLRDWLFYFCKAGAIPLPSDGWPTKRPLERAENVPAKLLSTL